MFARSVALEHANLEAAIRLVPACASLHYYVVLNNIILFVFIFCDIIYYILFYTSHVIDNNLIKRKIMRY